MLTERRTPWGGMRTASPYSLLKEDTGTDEERRSSHMKKGVRLAIAIMSLTMALNELRKALRELSH